MIIDAHCHAGTGGGLTGPWNTRAPLGRYLRRARAAGIDRTVIFPVFSRDYARANRQVAGIAAQHPGRLIFFASIHPRRDQDRARDLLRVAVEELGACGLKVHRHDAPATRVICETAGAYGIPIIYDVSGETYRMEILAREYPQVSFIIPHLGSFGDDWRAHVAVIDQLARFPNVYADTSGVRRFDFLARAVRRAGPHKLIFGSDGPYLHPGLELYKIRLLKLPPEDEQLILGENLRRLARLAPERAPAPIPA
jgi:predicted TIM-barrel fold metal-dependent hydrolase